MKIPLRQQVGGAALIAPGPRGFLKAGSASLNNLAGWTPFILERALTNMSKTPLSIRRANAAANKVSHKLQTLWLSHRGMLDTSRFSLAVSIYI